jgi:hypothetical protein
MLNVFLQDIRIHQNVVQESCPSPGEKFPQNVVHEMLKAGWHIGQTKGYDCMLEMTISCPKSGFPLCPLCNLEKIVCVLHVQLGIPFGFLQSCQNFLKKRE